MNLENVYQTLREICLEQYEKNGEVYGVSTKNLAQKLDMQRANVSRELGKLYDSNKIKKNTGKPVIYYIDISEINNESTENSIFDKVIGCDGSLKNQIALAKAAVVYPPKGLHTLIVGETGVGKSFFAKCMFKYAVEINKIRQDRFVVFNCADYANNPQLLISHLFGVKKGAYTGASEDKEGIIEKGRDGILLLDEVHRLPAEGQEMLFTLIDESKYTPLGSTKEISINLMLICATTENIDSTLLKTFARRIPVTISMPPLRERSIKDRLNMIKIFIEEESRTINRGINIEEEALSALMNYECENNIGQLKSDIQISCAKAFLREYSHSGNINLMLGDFSEEVRKGLLKCKKIIPYKWKSNNNTLLNVNEDESLEDKYNVSRNIYEFMEKRSKELLKKGYSSDHIRNKLINEVEDFINEFLNDIKNKNNDNEIKGLVNSELYEILDDFMILAKYKLKRDICKNTFLGLLIHINIFLNRVKENKEIVNPKVDEIRKKYPSEFKLAMRLADKLEDKYGINVPIGEIGFIAMFFAGNKAERKKRVSVIVAMHGNSTATSMAEVANQLLNTNHIKAYDMALSLKPETALNDILEMAKELDEGMGLLLIVDMGSLNYFHEIIEQKTGIRVRTIDMASTPIVIEAARKALAHYSLDEIVESIYNERSYLSKLFNKPVESENKEIIITACLTGEGTALKLKDIIKNKFQSNKYEIINLSIEDKESFKIIVNKLQKNYKVKCIIGAFNPDIEDIEYISLEKLFNEYYGTDLLESSNNESVASVIENIKKVYKEFLDLQEHNFIVDSFVEILVVLKDSFKIQIHTDKLNGLMMHYGSLVEKLINRGNTPKCKKVQYIKTRHKAIFNTLKEKLKIVEDKLNITFSDDDIGNLIEILLEI